MKFDEFFENFVKDGGALPNCKTGDPGTGEKKECWCISASHACWNSPHRRSGSICSYKQRYQCPNPDYSATGVRTVTESNNERSKYKIYGPNQIAFTIRYRQSCS